MQINIESNIPLPRRNKTKGMIETLSKMNPGDSFVIPFGGVQNWRMAGYSIGIKLASRKINNEEERIWKI